MTVKPVVHVIDGDGDVVEQVVSSLSQLDLDSKSYTFAEDFLANYDPRAAPQCVVTEILLPRLVSGLELMRRLQSMGATSPVIFYTSAVDISMAVEVIKSGAFDLVPKSAHCDRLLERVQEGLSRDLDSANEARKLAERHLKWSSMTQREQEIALLVAEGQSSKQIAHGIHRSKKTVDAHRANIMRKLGVQTLAGLVRFIVGLGPSTHP